MTGGRPQRSELSRRRLLSAAATGVVAGLAGCGYRPGGGDLAWESSLDTGGLLGAGTERFAVTPNRLFSVRNQSGRTYDFDTSTWRDVENASVTAVDGTGTTRLDAETERQAVAPPAVTGESVVVPVEGGRVTAIDRGAARIDPDARGTAAETGDEESDADDDLRWQADEIATGGTESEESDESGESSESNESANSPGIDGVRASDRLVAAVAGTDLIALDAETGDRAFSVAEAWSGGDGAADRVAVDGGDVWAAIEGEGDGSGDESAESGGGLVRFDPSGERRAERSISADVDWIAVGGETLVVGSAGDGTVTGFDADLDRRFALSVPTPTDRPPIVEAGDGDGSARRLYLRRGGAIRALDIGAEAVAWERSDVPARRRPAVDANGIYAVGPREGDPVIVAVGADGEDRWTAPLPEGVGVDELFAVDGRLIVVDDGELYGLHATPGERWSLLG